MESIKIKYDGNTYWIDDDRYVFKMQDKVLRLVQDDDEVEDVFAEMARQQKKAKK